MPDRRLQLIFRVTQQLGTRVQAQLLGSQRQHLRIESRPPWFRSPCDSGRRLLQLYAFDWQCGHLVGQYEPQATAMPYMTYLHDLRALIETGEYAAALALIASGRVPPATAEATAEITVLKIAALNGLGRWNEAITTGESALTEFSALNLKRQVGHLHGLLGLAHMRIGSTRDAESHLRAAIHITTWDLGDPEEAIRQQRRLALLFLGLGSWRQAQYEIENAIALADKSGIVRESGGLRVNLAITLIKAGTLSSVPQLIAEAESFLDQAGQKKWLMQAHLVRANYLRISGQPRKALELLIPALQLTREQKYSREEAIALEYIGDCHLLQSEHKRALDHFEAAMKIADATAPDGDIVPEVCHRMGEALAGC